MRLILPFIVLLMLLACSSAPPSTSNTLPSSATTTATPPGKAAEKSLFDPSQIAKTDVDRIAEAHQREVFASLKLLAEKLYRRNPREWKKAGVDSMDAAVARLPSPDNAWRLPEFNGKQGSEVIVMAFREDYRGDRIAAFVGGLGNMIQMAFNGKTEFFILDDLDPQLLFNSARNVEIAVWRLSHARDSNGNLFLLSNEATGADTPQNLSFEREFGKIIGNLDLLSKVIADKTHRTIVKVLQSLATAMFLPVSLLK